MLDGLRGECSIAELCRKEGISQGVYYKWSKDFMEAGKKQPETEAIIAHMNFRNTEPLEQELEEAMVGVLDIFEREERLDRVRRELREFGETFDLS